MKKICISGGPCSGKSTCIPKIKEYIMQNYKDYNVFIVHETATELITGGIAPLTEINMFEFQKFVFKDQIEKEKLYDKLIEYYDKDKIVILYDRGLLDQMSYVTKEEFLEIIKEEGITFEEICHRYDTVIHLVSAAIGTDCYTTENNEARRETREEAIESERKTLTANKFCDKIIVVDNSTDFEEKVQKVLTAIDEILSEK